MNRRDILKAVLATPFALFATKSASAEDKYLKALDTPSGFPLNETRLIPEVSDSIGSMFENHHWTGKYGEYMKVERLAKTRDSYDYFFAVYPPGNRFSYHKRFEISSEVVERTYGNGQRYYDYAVAKAVEDYYAGMPTDRSLSIEQY